MQLHARDSASGRSTTSPRTSVGSEETLGTTTPRLPDERDHGCGRGQRARFRLGWTGIPPRDRGRSADRSRPRRERRRWRVLSPDAGKHRRRAVLPLARPLFAFVNIASLEDRTDLIGSFARFYTNDSQQFARDEGFYAAPTQLPRRTTTKSTTGSTRSAHRRTTSPCNATATQPNEYGRNRQIRAGDTRRRGGRRR